LVVKLTVSHFEEVFGRGAGTCVAEAPGRVNLIGDHTDYNGLPVFPMALQRRFRLMFRVREDARVRAVALDGYEPREFTIGREIEPFEQGAWGHV
jgi:galactokinase